VAEISANNVRREFTLRIIHGALSG
jgi:hypothetical protein